MKKIIRFLARISGVEADIEDDTIKRIGYDTSMLAGWFCAEDINAQNALGILGWQLQRCRRIYYKEVRDKYQRWKGADFCRANERQQDEL